MHCICQFSKLLGLFIWECSSNVLRLWEVNSRRKSLFRLAGCLRRLDAMRRLRLGMDPMCSPSKQWPLLFNKLDKFNSIRRASVHQSSGPDNLD